MLSVLFLEYGYIVYKIKGYEAWNNNQVIISPTHILDPLGMGQRGKGVF